jgi:hypothetical protein
MSKNKNIKYDFFIPEKAVSRQARQERACAP